MVGLLFCRIEVHSSASILENQCHQKYGKSGKSFYCSQVASTVRWLSTADSIELTNHLGISDPSPSANKSKQEEEPSASSPNTGNRDVTDKESHGATTLQVLETAPINQSCSRDLPQIPSFSEFVHHSRATDNSKEKLQRRPEKNMEKRARLK